jgi:D-alanine transaminase
VLEEVAGRAGVKARTVAVSESELRAADEILLGAATREVQPVTTLDGKSVGSGKPGPVWRKLYDAYQAYKRELAGKPW